MKAAFHYIVRTKLIRFIKENEIDFLEIEEKFENENPIIAREHAFRFYQNYIDVLLEAKGLKYVSDRQTRIELNSYLKSNEPVIIQFDGREIDISEGYGNGIGIYMILDKPKDGTNEIGDEFIIHGIGDYNYSNYNLLYINLSFIEYEYYKFYNYFTNNLETDVVFFSEWEWKDGYGDDQPETRKILKTPIDWTGFDKIFWWGKDDIQKSEDVKKNPITIEDIIKIGECNQIEFKPSLVYNFSTGSPGISVKGIIAKTICAFLNSKGGFLLIGINDKGEVIGLENDYKLSGYKDPKDFLRLEFDQMLKHFLSFSVKDNIQTQIIEVEGKDILYVRVWPSKYRPVFLNGQTCKEFYVRGEASTRQLDIEEFYKYYIDKWCNNDTKN